MVHVVFQLHLISLFFVIKLLFFFSHTTSQHNIHSEQTKHNKTKQNNERILPIQKVHAKGREREKKIK